MKVSLIKSQEKKKLRKKPLPFLEKRKPLEKLKKELEDDTPRKIPFVFGYQCDNCEDMATLDDDDFFLCEKCYTVHYEEYKEDDD